MRRNNQTNGLIMLLVIVGDIVLLNIVLYVFAMDFPKWKTGVGRIYDSFT